MSKRHTTRYRNQKSKIQRAKDLSGAKGSATATVSPQRESFVLPELEPSQPSIEAEFAVEQRYIIKPDERLIDEHLNRTHYSHEDNREADRLRFKRMYRAIVSNEESLSTVLHYIVLAEHDAETGDEGYVEAHFKRPMDFSDIVTLLCPTFHPEDRQWWEDVVQVFQQAQEKFEKTQDDSDTFDLFLQVGALEYAFAATCKQSGWSLLKLEYQCEDCGSIS